MTTREAFETEARKHGFILDRLDKSGEYVQLITEQAWSIWQAAKANTTDITLRDYFAARAMAAYLIADQGNTPEPEQTANAAYFMANAMLEAREI